MFKHFRHRLVHIYGYKVYVRMIILKNYKNLMRETLSHPLDPIKVKFHFFEFI